jgi:hypothetical protein
MPAARDFLVRGLLAGLLAGIVAFGVAYVVGEPSINAAIAVEESAVADGHDHRHPSLAEDAAQTAVVPRPLQSTLGLLTGTSLFGVTLGGLIGVLSALALGRFGRTGPRASTLLVAAVGFVSMYAVPFVAYPPNPPAVGQSDTIGARTVLYLLLVAISVIAAVTSVLTGRWAAPRVGSWYAGVAAGTAYLVVVVTAVVVMPTYDEVPVGFPAGVLYEFRAASFLTQLALWTVLAVILAELVHRRVSEAAEPRKRVLAGR